jgi:uncharacterized membrane protein
MRTFGLRGFCGAESGGIVMIAALSAVLSIATLGIAVDQVRVSRISAAIQTVLDGAALAAAEPAALSDTDRLETARHYISSEIGKVPGLTTFQTTVTSNDGRVVVSGSGTIRTAFLRVLTIPTLRVSEISAAEQRNGLTCVWRWIR